MMSTFYLAALFLSSSLATVADYHQDRSQKSQAELEYQLSKYILTDLFIAQATRVAYAQRHAGRDPFPGFPFSIRLKETVAAVGADKELTHLLSRENITPRAYVLGMLTVVSSCSVKAPASEKTLINSQAIIYCRLNRKSIARLLNM